MSYMEIKSSTFIINCFFLFLILSLPYFSRGGSEALDSEIYEIDYRGPETHSSIPPPDHSHGKPHYKSYPAATKPITGVHATMKQKVRKVQG